MTTFVIVKAVCLLEKPDAGSRKLGTVLRDTEVRGELRDDGFIATSGPVPVWMGHGSMATASGFMTFLDFARIVLEEPVPMRDNDDEVFCAAVTDAAREASTDRDYLLAASYALSRNLTDLGTGAGRAGPFGFTADAWAEAIGPGAAGDLDVSLEDRLRWYMQPAVAAALAADRAWAFEDLVGRPPRYNELFFVELLGDGAAEILHGKLDDEVAAAIDAASLDPALAAELKTAPVGVDAVLAKLQTRLANAHAEARKVIDRQHPEIRFFRAHENDPPWMAIAREEMSAGVSEDANLQNTSRIDAYFTTVGATSRATTPWCAAFVGHCVAQSGIAEIAATIGPGAVTTRFWETWGQAATGPYPVGSVVVLKPRHSEALVGFLAEGSTDRVTCLLGGNQGGHGTGPDSVGIVSFPVASNPIVAVRTMAAPGLVVAPTASVAAPHPPVAPNTPIAWGARVGGAFKEKVIRICNTLGCSSDHLMAAIAFETGETFSPSRRNPINGATGLIRFMPDTAAGLGTSLPALAAMTALEQLDFVLRHFLPRKGRLNTVPDLYMGILLPAAVGMPESTTLFRRPSIEYERNRGLDRNGDGIVTKAEAAALVVAELDKGLGSGFKG
jgi:hypothetical protein